MDRAAEQKENILKTAYALFKANGYVKTTTREIANACGIKKGLLHYYYPRKDDIIIEIYSSALNGVYDYIEHQSKGKYSGFTYYSVINILLMRLLTGQFFNLDNLSELAGNRGLIQLKIKKLSETAYKIVHDTELPLSQYSVYLAVTASVGAETEMLLSILDGQLKMTFDKLATTTTKLFFTMLKVQDAQIRLINDEALKIVEGMDSEAVYNYIIEQNQWLG